MLRIIPIDILIFIDYYAQDGLIKKWLLTKWHVSFNIERFRQISFKIRQDIE